MKIISYWACLVLASLHLVFLAVWIWLNLFTGWNPPVNDLSLLVFVVWMQMSLLLMAAAWLKEYD